MDKDVYDGFAQIKAEQHVYRMILGQLLINAVADTPDPQKSLSDMCEGLARRLAHLPIIQEISQRDAQLALIQKQLKDFFASLRSSLPNKESH